MRHKRNREYFHISNLHRRYDRQQGKFIFNIAYETTTKITPRTLSVAQAFGLGIDEQRKFAIYDNVELRIGQGDVVYITGDSGSGKSVLLKAIKTDLGEDCADVADVKPDADKPIVDMIGKNLNEALELLSKAGLDDAFLFV
jgi:ABC-type ATPase with predicted acetyltransferase domain